MWFSLKMCGCLLFCTYAIKSLLLTLALKPSTVHMLIIVLDEEDEMSMDCAQHQNLTVENAWWWGRVSTREHLIMMQSFSLKTESADLFSTANRLQSQLSGQGSRTSLHLRLTENDSWVESEYSTQIVLYTAVHKYVVLQSTKLSLTYVVNKL